MIYGSTESPDPHAGTPPGDHETASCAHCGHTVPPGSFIESLLEILRSHFTNGDIDEYFDTAREYLKASGGKVSAWTRENPAKVTTSVAALALGAGLVYSATRRREELQQMEEMIGAMLPRTTVPLPVQVLQARRNAEGRTALFQEFGALTSAQVGEMAGSKSPNRAALAHKWKNDRRIFAVPHQGVNYFPGFQFSPDGQPLPVIGAILAHLSAWSAWEIALWFTSRTDSLSGRRPVDLLESDPDAVVRAAASEAEELVF
jgi:hypothetical protein